MPKSNDDQFEEEKPLKKKKKPVQADEEVEDRPVKKKKKQLSGKEQYNVISDTVTGANVRWKDNLIQAVGIFLFVLIGAAVGWFTVAPHFGDLGGVMVGVLGGLVVGFLVTGFALMIFRMVKHSRGEHD